jgi:anaerobic selenocysteine-containing dehydrogenase
MASYRVYYCDANGKIFSADDFEAADDAGAVARAGTLVNGRATMFEVWRRDRLIHRSLRRAPAQESGRPPPLDRASQA